MKTTLRNLVLIFPLLFSDAILAKGSSDTLRLDLAASSPGSVISVPGNRDFGLLVLENTIDRFSYRVEINNVAEAPAPLSMGSGPTDFKKGITECGLLKNKVHAVEAFLAEPDAGTTGEKQLAQLLRDMDRERLKVKCTDFDSMIHVLHIRTRRVIIEPIQVRTGHTVTITIRRDTLVWTFIYKGDEHGRWLTTYGFGMTFSALENRTYFTKHQPDSNSFVITKAKRPKNLDLHYTPAVFFSYFPYGKRDKAYNWSWTGGLGFDLSAPVFFLGGSVTYRYNIGLSGGLALQQQYRLKEQYTENEIIPIALDIDQLHNKIYRPNFFISLNFRLDQNPFQNRANGEAGE